MAGRGVIPDEDAIFALVREREDFLDRVARGTPVNLAGFAVRWSPQRVKQELNDPQFAALVEAAIERSLDSIEETLHRKAVDGNMAAIQMVLFNRRAHRWRDVKRIVVRHEGGVSVQAVAATKAAAIELLREHGVRAMQALGPASAEIVEAEIVEDADH